MAKRSDIPSIDQQVINEIEEIERLEAEYGETLISTVSEETVLIRSKLPATITSRGGELPSGKVYVWEGAGSEVEVDRRDVDVLLSKRRGGSGCCGGDGSYSLFELA